MLFALFAMPAYAQDGSMDDQMDDSQKTPREQIIHELGLDDARLDGEVTDGVIKGDLINDDQAIAEPVLGLRGRSSGKTSLDILLDTVKAEIVIPEKPVVKITPFYISAQDYLSERGDEVTPQLILHYEVASGAASGAGLGTVKDVKLILGEDFAAMQVDKNLTIYDFKFNRILTIKPEYNMAGKTTKNLMFENTSLYAKAYRDIAAVRRATNNGRIKKLDMGRGTTLDAYWVESAMSWAAVPSDGDLTIDKSDKSLRVHRDGDVVFSAEFTDETYAETGVDKDSLFAFAHHEWPLHPSVLRALYAYDAPPKWFEMLSYGPTAPKGQKQIWTLVKQVSIEAVFPLSPSAIGVAQAKNASPLVFLINEAAHNRARGGIQSVKDMAQDFSAKVDMEAYGQAWIVGQKYVAYSGSCKNPDDPTICKAVVKIEQTQKGVLPSHIKDYMKAVSAARRKAQKGEAITILMPYLDKKDTPAFIIRTAAMARAKLKTAQAKSSGVTSINAENLLQTALAKDPYDPNTYVGLAQVLAAKGGVEQSWDIYDTLRADIPTADSLDLKINRLEQKLQKTAPGYFLE